MNMKYIYIILFTVVAMFCSCESYLDATEDNSNQMDEDMVFSNYNSYRDHVNSLYQGLTDYYSYVFNYLPGVYSDELQWSNHEWSTLAPNAIIKGDYWSGDRNNETTWSYWGESGKNNEFGRSPLVSAYKAIRIANKSIENIDKLDAEQQKKNELLGQAYFFRAWFHFEIIRRVGGMPYIESSFNSDDNMALRRPSYRYCTEKIVADCVKAAELLPKEWDQPSVDFGRVTRGAALALQGMALLYDASPTMNHLETGIYEYDKERLKQAIVPLNKVMTNYTGLYQLVNATTPAEYGSIFYSSTKMFSSEVIFGVPPSSTSGGYLKGTPYRFNNFYNLMFSPQPYDKRYTKRNSAPTHNLVLKFETASGEKFAEQSSYTAKELFENRDPRFYYSVLYDGVKFGEKNGKAFTFNTIGNIDGGANWTGYFIRKMWPEDANDLDGVGNYKYQQNWINIRLAAVYLNYAEAVYEVYGADVLPAIEGETFKYTALGAINELRSKRAHVPVPTSRYSELRDIIRNERAVELCFENNRWWDIRRWHIAHEPEVRKVYRLNLDATSRYVAEEMVGQERVFQDKHYWYPVDRDDVDMFENMEQNPGW